MKKMILTTAVLLAVLSAMAVAHAGPGGTIWPKDQMHGQP